MMVCDFTVVPAQAGTSLAEVKIHDCTGLMEQFDDTPKYVSEPEQNIPLMLSLSKDIPMGSSGEKTRSS